MNEEKQSYLDKLDEELYRRDRKPFYDVRIKLAKEDSKSFEWKKGEKVVVENNLNIKEPAKKTFSFFALGLFIVSVIVFAGSLAYAFYALSSGGLSVKQDNIVLNVDVPAFTNSGQNISGDFRLENINKAPLIESFVSLDVKNKETGVVQNVTQIDIGDIPAGFSESKNLDFVLQGREGEVRELIATYFYKISGSNSTFQKVISKEIKIQKSQAIINLSGPKNISLGQTADYKVSVRGGSAAVTNVSVRLDLPKDMKILESSIDPVSKNIYNLGNIREGEEKIITFKAIFQERQELANTFSMKATVGSTGESDITDVFAESSISIALKSTPFAIDVESEKQNTSSIYFTEKKPKLKITVTNLSDSPIAHAILYIKFAGGMFNSKAVTVTNAQYDASLGIIKADENTNKALKEILPGEKVTFDITLQDVTQTNLNASRKIIIDTSFTADVPDSTASPATVKNQTTLLPKENTLAGLKTYYFSGPFQNSGSMPPKVGVKNTYTIVASVETYGGFTKGQYSIILPGYVEFIKSDTRDAVYNKSKREIVWNVDSLNNSQSTLLGVSKKEAAFQVSIVPSPDQGRLAPKLTEQATFTATGIDRSSVNIDVPDVDINFSKDPKYEFSKGYGEVEE